MSLWQRIQAKLNKQPAALPQLTSPEESANIKAAVEAIEAPPKPPDPVPVRHASRGRVIKETKRPEYDPRRPRGGGRIVKTMPRQLQKLKQAQEKVEDDGDQPKIEELPD
jgi:hypothetical protein